MKYLPALSFALLAAEAFFSEAAGLAAVVWAGLVVTGAWPSSWLLPPASANRDIDKIGRLSIAVAAIMLAGLVISPDAYAQAIGGGGGGAFQQIIQWVVTNIVQGLIMIGILFCGAMLLSGHHHLGYFLGMAVGAIVIVNYQEIAGLIGVR